VTVMPTKNDDDDDDDDDGDDDDDDDDTALMKLSQSMNHSTSATGAVGRFLLHVSLRRRPSHDNRYTSLGSVRCVVVTSRSPACHVTRRDYRCVMTCNRGGTPRVKLHYARTAIFPSQKHKSH